jgi:rubredoxin
LIEVVFYIYNNKDKLCVCDSAMSMSILWESWVCPLCKISNKVYEDQCRLVKSAIRCIINLNGIIGEQNNLFLLPKEMTFSIVFLNEIYKKRGGAK